MIMMTKTVKNYATANIFGSYILRMKQVRDADVPTPQKKKTEKDSCFR